MKGLLLIGGSNIDYIGTSNEKLINKVSNLGRVSISFGGVMRNICDNLVRIGNKCTFITAIGNDSLGDSLKNDLISKNVDLICPNSLLPTSSYMAINDSDHDMNLAICDNRIIDEISEEFIESNRPLIEQYEYVLLDSNINEKTIRHLLKKFPNQKFICEAISPQRVVRYAKDLDKIYLLKCNIYEAQTLANEKLEKVELIQKLFDLGLKNVIVSSGKNDTYYGVNKKEIGFVKVTPLDYVCNTTGAGDALFSGIADKVVQGGSFDEAIKFGMLLSNETLKVASANSKEIEKYSYQHE